MVYNKSFYRSASLSEKLRARFGERTADAIFRATSGNQNADDAGSEKVMSFFGREASGDSVGRSIPSAKRIQKSESVQRTPSAPVRKGAKYARPVETAKCPAQKQNVQYSGVRRDPKVYTGTFGKAYMAGDRVRGITSNVKRPSSERYTGGVAKQSLKRGRADVAGSRHANVKTDLGAAGEKSRFARFIDTFRDNHKAEHRVRQAPFPFAYATIVVICAFMAMILLFSYSQVNEYKGKINDLNRTQAALSATADKLEVELELRDDIRKIESYAVDYIGMVNSDVVQTKFVSVDAEDRVEILKADEEEVEGGLSALLSAIGEGIGKFSEYFN